MGFAIDSVVPWGRSYQEYLAMFGLTEADLTRRILGCADGPAGFNAHLTKRGGTVVSIDPLYAFDAEEIRNRIAETYDTVLAQLRQNHHDFVWNTIPSVDALGRVRISAMNEFLADYEEGKRDGRYRAGALPSLPFDSGQFDLALSSHFLFLYSAHLSAEFHLQALHEMLRVARQVRVFPLLTLEGLPSPYLDHVTETLSALGYRVEIKDVSYEFQRGGNEMMVIRRA